MTFYEFKEHLLDKKGKEQNRNYGRYKSAFEKVERLIKNYNPDFINNPSSFYDYNIDGVSNDIFTANNSEINSYDRKLIRDFFHK